MIRLQPFGCPLTLAVVASHTSITSPCMRAASQSVGLTLAGTPGLPPLSRGSAAAPLEQAPSLQRPSPSGQGDRGSLSWAQGGRRRGSSGTSTPSSMTSR